MQRWVLDYLAEQNTEPYPTFELVTNLAFQHHQPSSERVRNVWAKFETASRAEMESIRRAVKGLAARGLVELGYVNVEVSWHPRRVVGRRYMPSASRSVLACRVPQTEDQREAEQEAARQRKAKFDADVARAFAVVLGDKR